jgi:long-chain acyl-CoA synthetase
VAETLIGIFLFSVDTYAKRVQFMRKRNGAWETISSERALADVESAALGLREMGVARGDHVAILSENRYEWPVADLALAGLGAVSVPIYPSLTAQQCRYILENAQAKIAIVSTQEQLEKVRSIAAELPSLATIVHFDPLASAGERCASFEALLDRGRQARAAAPDAFRAAAAEVEPDDLATIIYTSGTTGEPKGAMLRHSNIAFDVDACLKVVPLTPNDSCLSFLPLCHIFERMAGLYAMLKAGATITYAETMDSVAANAVEVKPTILTGVPRFYEKVYARVMENAATMPALRRRIFHWGLHQGIGKARAHFQGRDYESFTTRLADRLVASKIRERVGGRLRYCISGGAPLAPKVMEFFFAVGIPVIEGYGLTETSPVICLNVPGREQPGSVGPPIPGVEVRITEEGEIATRGPHVMIGYFGNEPATRAALRDGWFYTGDIGKMDPQGRLTITDRLKDLLVTAGGKKVAPQPLEARLKTSKWVSEAVLLGDRQPYIVCLIVPNFANLEAEANAHGWPQGSRAELIERPEARKHIQTEIDRVNRDLAQFEKIKKFALLEHELSAEVGELTPTLKVRRKIIAERYASVIDGLYSDRPEPATS